MPRFDFIKYGGCAYIRATAGHDEDLHVVAEKLEWSPERCMEFRSERPQTQRPEQGMGTVCGRSGPLAAAIPPPASCAPPQVLGSKAQLEAKQMAELRMLATTRQDHVDYLQGQLQQKEVHIRQVEDELALARQRVEQLESQRQEHPSDDLH
eukprot:609794-Amphidinium_carterae.1